MARTNNKKKRRQVLKRDEFTCQFCGESFPEYNLEADHIIPIQQGGPDNITNMQTLCKPCHARKTSTESGGRKLK